MKAGNTLDTLVTENGRGIVQHYLQDVGSTFGTGALTPRDGDEGHEYLSTGVGWWRGSTFGLFTQPWQTLDYEEHPEIGKFEGDAFEPENGSRGFRWRRCATRARTTRSGPRCG